MPMDKGDKEAVVERLLDFIYGGETGRKTSAALLALLRGAERGPGRRLFTHRDAFLISYADMLAPPAGQAGKDGDTALARLGRFLERRNRGSFSYLHLLPFHPYTSDDGFSVVDYRRVDGRFGSWEDIAALGGRFKMAFDFVVNHGSVQSPWFQGFLAGDKTYEGWYVTRSGDYDASSVVRPRTSPLLIPFIRKDGSKVYVWTTFSADQVDYDFSNPAALLEFMRIFLEFVQRGARIVRFDAIGYLWKEDGHPCIHHPKTHAVVKLFRAVAEALDLDVLILTETNVPHAQNVAYFGEGDEADMVYNFALPPLVLHAMLSADAGPLRAWARTLPSPDTGRLFLNYLASHDGVGVVPAKGLVEDAAFAATVEEARKRGALVSYKDTPEGPVPYELNCNYLSIVAPPSLGSADLRARAFLAAQAVLLSLSGLPAVYFHSWIGSEAWTEGPELLGYNRAVNRERPPIDLVETQLDEAGSLRSLVYKGVNRLLAFRQAEEAFSPTVPQRVLDAGGSVFALLRGPVDGPGGKRWVVCAQNLGGSPAQVRLAEAPLERLDLRPWETRWIAFGAGEGRELSTAEGQHGH
ncbi:MAG: sugar phosphorylase [Treponema sp.]|jgi:sucrose phosphorylase|nr:sugar phosphorylase [Treponema sp.]